MRTKEEIKEWLNKAIEHHKTLNTKQNAYFVSFGIISALSWVLKINNYISK